MYPGVPPTGDTLAEPLLPPEQLTGVALQIADTAVGWVTVDEQVVLQPLASVTVTV